MSLQETKNIYKSNADAIKGWERIDLNTLCDTYVNLPESDLKRDAYLSAIICKCWKSVNTVYNSQGIKVASIEDCYDWVIDSIMYCLNHHVWTDPDHKLYQDPKAPEKSINVILKSLKNNFFYLAKMQKRVLNYNALSMEDLIEKHADSAFPAVVDGYDYREIYIQDLIKGYFDRQEYFYSFAIDAIAYLDMFDNDRDEEGVHFAFNRRKLRKHLRTLAEDKYNLTFAARYGIALDKVDEAIPYITKLSQAAMDTRIDRLFKTLKHENEFKEVLRC